MTADNHIHTKYSPDGHGDPEGFILRAIDMGAKHICFTEHVDIMYVRPDVCMGDIDGYFSRVRYLKSKYSGRIYIGVGLEVGYTEKNKLLNAEFLDKYKPDYVINSIHEVNGKDCYYRGYFDGKSAKETYTEYLTAVLASLDAPYNYNAVGHIGYVCRTSPYPELLYDIAPDLIDEICRKIIDKGKIMEINTNGKKATLKTVPERAVFMRYASLGGKKTCFSSDAHRACDIGRNYDYAAELAADAGINYQTVIENGKEIQLPF